MYENSKNSNFERYLRYQQVAKRYQTLLVLHNHIHNWYSTSCSMLCVACIRFHTDYSYRNRGLLFVIRNTFRSMKNVPEVTPLECELGNGRCQYGGQHPTPLRTILPSLLLHTIGPKSLIILQSSTVPVTICARAEGRCPPVS